MGEVSYGNGRLNSGGSRGCKWQDYGSDVSDPGIIGIFPSLARSCMYVE